jgi:uncharacterized Ntn-hydrolase superfamily protein
MTFSISARCALTGMLGIAVSSSSPCVAARCAHARARVGVVATQNITDPTLGPRGLDLLARGLSPAQAMKELSETSAHFDYRQVVLLDREGRAAWHSGAKTLGVHAVAAGTDAVAAGNLLSTTEVPRAMVDAFAATPDAGLGDRLIGAMQAGLAAGGEAGPVHSAGMLLVDTVGWAVADLRIDWTEGGVIAELAALWRLWQPQMEAYVTRALNPASAPSYAVPGNE